MPLLNGVRLLEQLPEFFNAQAGIPRNAAHK